APLHPRLTVDDAHAAKTSIVMPVAFRRSVVRDDEQILQRAEPNFVTAFGDAPDVRERSALQLLGKTRCEVDEALRAVGIALQITEAVGRTDPDATVARGLQRAYRTRLRQREPVPAATVEAQQTVEAADIKVTVAALREREELRV